MFLEARSTGYSLPKVTNFSLLWYFFGDTMQIQICLPRQHRTTL